MGWQVANAGTELKYRNSREREREIDKLNCLQGRNIGGFHHTELLGLTENSSSSSDPDTFGYACLTPSDPDSRSLKIRQQEKKFNPILQKIIKLSQKLMDFLLKAEKHPYT